MNIDAIVNKFDPENDYTAKEIAQIIGFSSVAVLTAVRRGKLKARKVFNRLYIKGKDIRNYLIGDK